MKIMKDSGQGNEKDSSYWPWNPSSITSLFSTCSFLSFFRWQGKQYQHDSKHDQESTAPFTFDVIGKKRIEVQSIPHSIPLLHPFFSNLFFLRSNQFFPLLFQSKKQILFVISSPFSLVSSCCLLLYFGDFAPSRSNRLISPYFLLIRCFPVHDEQGGMRQMMCGDEDEFGYMETRHFPLLDGSALTKHGRSISSRFSCSIPSFKPFYQFTADLNS